MAGKCLIKRYQDTVAQKLAPVQLGVGSRSGAETIIHKVRSWYRMAPPDHVLLQLDFKNAYNSINRTAMLQAVEEHCPLFRPYAQACYSNPAVLYGQNFQLSSEEGEHQGCPCGPLFCAVTTIQVAKFKH